MTQDEAITICLNTNRNIVAVSGRAGTGKTTIIKTIHDALLFQGWNIAVCAPTGKAARRITEATGIEAQTIHKLLGFPQPGDPNDKRKANTGEPTYNSYNRLPFNCVLVDEYSMVNTYIHSCLMQALPVGSIIRVFGDINQLAPIEDSLMPNTKKASPFKTLLNKFNGIELTQIFRQTEESEIIANASRILQGAMVHNGKKEFDLCVTPNPIDFFAKLLHKESLPDLSQLQNQLLTPMNVGGIGGANKLNTVMQAYYNDTKFRTVLPRHPNDRNALSIAVNDKILITKNWYTIGVLNGDVGYVQCFQDDGSIIVQINGLEVTIPANLSYVNKYRKLVTVDPRKDLQLAYAITTHKAQGSEYDTCIYLLSKQTRFMQCRPNLYTALTRAKNCCIIISDKDSLTYSIANITSLCDMRNAQNEG